MKITDTLGKKKINITEALMRCKIILIIGLLLIISCGKKFDMGIIEDNVYKNEFFQIEFPNLNDWEIQTGIDQMNRPTMLSQGNNKSSQRKNKFDRFWNLKDVKGAQLFIASKTCETSISDYKMTIQYFLMCQNLKNLPTVKTAADFLDYQEQSEKNISFDKGSKTFSHKTITIDGHLFESLVVNPDNVNFTEYIAFLHKGFILYFRISYQDMISCDPSKSQREEIIEQIQNLKFL